VESDREEVDGEGLLTPRDGKVVEFIMVFASLNSEIGVSTVMLSFIFFSRGVIEFSAAVELRFGH